MAPVTKSWKSVKNARLATRRMAFNSMSAASAFRRITQSNIENTTGGYIRRMEERAAAEKELLERENLGTRLTKEKKPPRKSRVEKPKKITKPRKRAKNVIGDEDEKEPEEPESWRPCGGEFAAMHADKTRYLGIARVSAWQYEKFEQGAKELFEPFNNGEFRILADEVEVGGEILVDVKVPWPDADTAEMVKDTIEPAMVLDRKAQITYVQT